MKKTLIPAVLAVATTFTSVAHADEFRNTDVALDNIIPYSNALCGTRDGRERISNGRGDRTVSENEFCDKQLQMAPFTYQGSTCVIAQFTNAFTGVFENKAIACVESRAEAQEMFKQRSFEL